MTNPVDFKSIEIEGNTYRLWNYGAVTVTFTRQGRFAPITVDRKLPWNGTTAKRIRQLIN